MMMNRNVLIFTWQQYLHIPEIFEYAGSVLSAAAVRNAHRSAVLRHIHFAGRGVCDTPDTAENCIGWRESNPSRLTNENFPNCFASNLEIRQYICDFRLCTSKNFLFVRCFAVPAERFFRMRSRNLQAGCRLPKIDAMQTGKGCERNRDRFNSRQPDELSRRLCRYGGYSRGITVHMKV